MTRFLLLSLYSFLIFFNNSNAQIPKGTPLLEANVRQHTLDWNQSFNSMTTTTRLDLSCGYFLGKNFLIGTQGVFQQERLEFISPSPLFSSSEFVQKINNGGGQLFIRKYGNFGDENPENEFMIFGEMSGGRFWQTSQSGEVNELETDLEAHLTLVNFGIGFSGKMTDGLFWEIFSNHPIWTKYSDVGVKNISNLHQFTHWEIRSKLRILLEPNIAADKYSPLFKKGDMAASGSFRMKRDSATYQLDINHGWFVTDKFMIGVVVPLHLRFQERDEYYRAGIGIFFRRYLPIHGRFGFYGEIAGTMEKINFENGSNSSELYSLKPSIGINYFLRKRVVLECSFNRPLMWYFRDDIDNILPEDNYQVVIKTGLRFFIR